jgi:hypothetical protein
MNDIINGKLISKERQEVGIIKKRAWCAYFNNVGRSFCFFILFVYLVRESAKLGMELWLSSWSDIETNRNTSTANQTLSTAAVDPLNDPITSYYLYGYLTWACVALLVAVLRSILLLYASLNAAKKTFRDLIQSIIHAPMHWYDTTRKKAEELEDISSIIEKIF